MIGALGYLTIRSLHNRLARQLDRLRTPRYAIALALGLAYLWLIGVQQRPQAAASVSPAVVELVAAGGVVVVVLWTWIFGAERTALAFSPAEATLLFPAPLTRRQLIRYKLLRGQLVVLFNVVLWTLLLPRGWTGAGSWMRALALWLLLTTLSWHRMGAALLRSSLLQHGRAALRRHIIALLVVAMAVAAALADAADAVPALRTAWGVGLEEFLIASHDAASGSVTGALLHPFRLVVRPLLAEGWSAWAAAVVPAGAILALHYVWVIRSDAAFQESAAAASLARARSGGARSARPTFTTGWIPPLAPSGWPAGALLWKNLVAVVRVGRARTVSIAFAAAALAVVVLSLHGGAGGVLEIAGWLAAMWGTFLLVLGPQWVRNDLRGDLSRVAVLRSYPLRGREVVGAATAASTLVLTLLQIGLAIIAWLALLGADPPEPSLKARTLVLVGAAVFLPAINFLGVLIHNGAALILPAWVHHGRSRATGVEALGQNMLVMSGFLVILGLLLVPPAAAAAAVFLGFQTGFGGWAAVPAALAGLAIAGLEARLLLSRLGQVFEETDPASVPPPDSA